MLIAHIHDALAQVRRLQEAVLGKRFFEGYSGKARILSGCSALAGALVLEFGAVPATPRAHLAVWAVVAFLALAFNYGALLHWVLTEPRVRQHPVILKPALDALPALFVGGIMTLALVRSGHFDPLFGTWMALFGVAHMAYRQSLPGENYFVGLFYVLCGAACLLAPGIHFTSPWPMGLVFFAGELAGGSVLLVMNDREKDLEELENEEN